MLIGVEYESKPHICDCCGIIGHQAPNCNAKLFAMSPVNVQEVPERGRTATRPHASNRKRLSRSRKKSQRGKSRVSVPLVPSVPIMQVLENQGGTSGVQDIASLRIEYDSSLLLQLAENNAQDPSSSSSLSVPPGFQKFESEPCPSVTTPPIGAHLAAADLEADSACVTKDMPPVDIEEGEFTPVISKKSKKKSKQAEKPRVKVVGRKTGPCRVPFRKGAKHSVF